MSSQGAPCAVCGSFYNVEMHYIRPLKDIDDSKSKLDKYKSCYRKSFM